MTLNPVISSVLIVLGAAYLVALVYLICRKRRRSSVNGEYDSDYEEAGRALETQEYFTDLSSQDDETSATGSFNSCYSKAKNTMSNSSVA